MSQERAADFPGAIISEIETDPISAEFGAIERTFRLPYMYDWLKIIASSVAISGGPYDLSPSSLWSRSGPRALAGQLRCLGAKVTTSAWRSPSQEVMPQDDVFRPPFANLKMIWHQQTWHHVTRDLNRRISRLRFDEQVNSC
jgi:hypothetical protein